jgi:hypothetical protein
MYNLAYRMGGVIVYIFASNVSSIPVRVTLKTIKLKIGICWFSA